MANDDLAKPAVSPDSGDEAQQETGGFPSLAEAPTGDPAASPESQTPPADGGFPSLSDGAFPSLGDDSPNGGGDFSLVGGLSLLADNEEEIEGIEASVRNSSAGTPAAADFEDDDEDDGDFSLLELRDRVVIMMSFKQLVASRHIKKAWKKWTEGGGKASGEALWRVLANEPDVDRDQVFACAAEVYAFEDAVIRPNIYTFLKELADVFSKDQWQRFSDQMLIPFNRDGLSWVFVTHDPTHPGVTQLMKALGIRKFELQYAPESAVQTLIAEGFPGNTENEFLERVEEGFEAFDLGTTYEVESGGLIDQEALEAEMGRSSLINLFEASLLEAVRRGVSDVHIFPNSEQHVEIHFRIDGQLERWYTDKRMHAEAFLAVVKDNSMNVDRFERDAAQDGFIQRVIDDTLIRFRVSVLPVANASHDIRSESIVIRVLDDRNVITDLRKLGLAENALRQFEWASSQPNGMVILTGPTGSGKTTTLFACLHRVVSPKVNVLTVEDPVEYLIPGVRQIKLNHKLGLEQAIRAILRHDPDIVMVGEMRDKPTADLAIKLANTGHLTFSTLHTNDAPSAVSRLFKMGVEPFLIAYAINLVVAQRLIRKLCPKCKTKDNNKDKIILERIGFTEEEIDEIKVYKAGNKKSCKTCRGTGYKGRRAITETLPFTPELRSAIVRSEGLIDEDEIARLGKEAGMFTLLDSAREILKVGETSIEELFRVVATEM